MIMRKGQTALEYLMTYGWAILIVIVAIGALYALGLTKPCRWVGTQITGFTGGGFEVSTPRFDASDGSLVFDLKRLGASTITYNSSIAVWKGTTSTDDPVDFNMATGDSSTRTFSSLTGASSGDCYSADVTITYTESGRSFTALGKVSGTIEA